MMFIVIGLFSSIVLDPLNQKVHVLSLLEIVKKLYLFSFLCFLHFSLEFLLLGVGPSGQVL